MKEIPMLFSTPMVQAELDGRKTMTRRLKGLEIVNMHPDKWSSIKVDSPFKPADIFWFEGQGERVAVKCPYGQPGDLIYVRETWSWDWKNYPERTEKYYYYKASTGNEFLASGEKWKPSIRMPKVAARIWLQVTNIRVEQLQDITEEDAKAEGVEPGPFGYKNYDTPDETEFESAKDSFESLWVSINGAESWQQNPFVWIIEFKVLSTTGKPSLLTENKTMSNLTPELQKQIEQEAKSEAKKLTGRVPIFRMGYEAGHYDGAESYALKWQAAEQRAEIAELKLESKRNVIVSLQRQIIIDGDKIERYEKALKAIREWELPPTGKFWDGRKTQPMSYEACYGSNGVRDYFKRLANEALTPKTTTDDTANG